MKKGGIDMRRKGLVAGVLALVLLVCTGCGTRASRAHELKKMLSGDITLNMTYQTDGGSYAVRLSLAPENGAVRQGEARFLSPPSMEGLTVVKSSDGIALRLGELTLNAPSGEMYAFLFLPFDIRDMDYQNTLYQEDAELVSFENDTKRVLYTQKKGQPPSHIELSTSGKVYRFVLDWQVES